MTPGWSTDRDIAGDLVCMAKQPWELREENVRAVAESDTHFREATPASGQRVENGGRG